MGIFFLPQKLNMVVIHMEIQSSTHRIEGRISHEHKLTIPSDFPVAGSLLEDLCKKGLLKSIY